jgi:hypothetical protein
VTNIVIRLCNQMVHQVELALLHGLVRSGVLLGDPLVPRGRHKVAMTKGPAGALRREPVWRRVCLPRLCPPRAGVVTHSDFFTLHFLQDTGAIAMSQRQVGAAARGTELVRAGWSALAPADRRRVHRMYLKSALAQCDGITEIVEWCRQNWTSHLDGEVLGARLKQLDPDDSTDGWLVRHFQQNPDEIIRVLKKRREAWRE